MAGPLRAGDVASIMSRQTIPVDEECSDADMNSEKIVQLFIQSKGG
jgi:hypothetical protein